jgi:predicted NBD/HSP70 family sugar kinase
MYLAFDIGGTKMRVAASNDCKTFLGEPRILNTPKSFEEGIELFKKTAKECCEDCDVDISAGGIAGTLDAKRTLVTNAPNLPSDWIGKPLKSALEKALDSEVYLENDTAIVGLGETHFGAGSADGIEVYITVSTGVGGVRIVDGRIDRSYCGFEIGHQIIDVSQNADSDYVACRDCEMVDLESMVSGSAIERRFEKKPYDIEQSNPLWQNLAELLAVGVYNTILHWSPERVVLGGSMMVGDPVIPIQGVEGRLVQILKALPVPEIRKAKLGSVGGLYGGLAYIVNHKPRHKVVYN